MFRIIDGTIEYDGLAVATILPGVWPSRRDYIQQTLDGFDPSSDEDNTDELKDTIERLEARIADLEATETVLENEYERGFIAGEAHAEARAKRKAKIRVAS